MLKCTHAHTHARSQSQAQKLKVNTVGVVELLFIRRLLSVCVFVFQCARARLHMGLVGDGGGGNNKRTFPQPLQSEGSQFSTSVFLLICMFFKLALGKKKKLAPEPVWKR